MKTKTLLDLRIAQNIEGVPGGQVKLVKGNHDYALFVNDKYLGSFDAPNDQIAMITGLNKMKELIVMLVEA